jgi:hypothetical protein
MIRKFAIFAAAIAAFALTCQAASAAARKELDPRVTGVSWVVGGAATGAYYGTGNPTAAAWGVTTFGCAVVSPMVATVVLNRQLSYREAHILIGSCIVPIVGGWLVNEGYNAGIFWAPDEQPVKKARRAKKK